MEYLTRNHMKFALPTGISVGAGLLFAGFNMRLMN